MLENEDSLDSVLGTVTQSDSSVGTNGFDGRLGLSTVVCVSVLGRGGCTEERAIFPFSSHHL